MSGRHYSLGEMAKALGGVVGTFTPELWDDSLSGSEGQTYVTQEGTHLRVGHMVFYSIRIVVSGLGTLTVGQNARIGGLPYNADDHAPINVGYARGMNLPTASAITGYVNNGSSFIVLQLFDSTVGGSDLIISEFSATGDIMLNGWYFTDDAP